MKSTVWTYKIKNLQKWIRLILSRNPPFSLPRFTANQTKLAMNEFTYFSVTKTIPAKLSAVFVVSSRRALVEIRESPMSLAAAMISLRTARSTRTGVFSDLWAHSSAEYSMSSMVSRPFGWKTGRKWGERGGRGRVIKRM